MFLISILCQQKVLLGLFLAVITLIWWFLKKKYQTNLPRGPTGFPVVGYLPFLGPQPQEKLLELRKDYGNIFTMKMGSFTVVVLNGREVIKEALITNGGVFDTRPGFFTFSKLTDRLAFGLFNERWIVLKKIVVNRFNAFMNDKTYSIDNLIADESANLIADIMKHNEMPFDPKMDLYVTFCSVIYQIVYGRGTNVRDDEDFLEHLVKLKDIIDFATSGNPAEVMPWLAKVFPSSVKPVLDGLEHMAFLRNKKQKEHIESFDKENIRDLTDSFIDLREETLEMRTVELTFAQLAAVLEEMISAGFDTSATTMRWIILCLIKFPGIQEELYEEIDKVLGDRPPSVSDRPNMPYAEAVILETLRFKTPIPLSLPHAAVKDAVLCGYDIPKDTVILINLHSLTRDHEVWVDPNAFHPQHFLTSDGKLDTENASMIAPFSLGKRKCIGEHLARHNLFMTLVYLVQRFKLLPVAGEKYDMVGVNGLTDSPKPFKIIAKAR